MQAWPCRLKSTSFCITTEALCKSDRPESPWPSFSVTRSPLNATLHLSGFCIEFDQKDTEHPFCCASGPEMDCYCPSVGFR
jgi:hypothetical protein